MNLLTHYYTTYYVSHSCQNSEVIHIRLKNTSVQRFWPTDMFMCLECLAHGRACLWGFRLEQASGGHAATIIRIRCMHDYSAYYSDRIEYE